MSAKRNKQYDELEKFIKKSNYKKIFIFYPYTEWDIPVFQRPQQIALSLTKNKDKLILESDFYLLIQYFHMHFYP